MSAKSTTVFLFLSVYVLACGNAFGALNESIVINDIHNVNSVIMHKQNDASRDNLAKTEILPGGIDQTAIIDQRKKGFERKAYQTLQGTSNRAIIVQRRNMNRATQNIFGRHNDSFIAQEGTANRARQNIGSQSKGSNRNSANIHQDLIVGQCYTND